MTILSRFENPRRMPCRRQGITLLETMIAMGVLAIGVMSVAALLPVGRSQMTDADVFDHASAVGRAAFRDLHVHGYLRPTNWVYVDPGGPRPVTLGSMMLAPPTSGGGATGKITAPSVFEMTPPAMPLVLDPLLIALNSPSAKGQYTPPGVDGNSLKIVATFPAGLQVTGWPGSWPEKTAPLIPRISVRDAPNLNPNTVRIMPLGVADRLFHSTDDAVFALPTSELSLAGGLNQNLNPQQVCIIRSMSAAGAPTNISRASKGDYSYFVTLTPDFSETWGVPGWYTGTGNNASYNMYQGNAATNRMFNAAVVVCYKRDLRTFASDYDLAKTYDRGERMVWVDFLGRGEVRLRVAGIASKSDAEKALAVKPSQWIMVTGRFDNYAQLPSITPAFASTKSWKQTTIKWYRVISALTEVDQDGSSNTTWYRSARVAGSDWTPGGVSTAAAVDQVFYDEDPYSYADMVNAASANPPTGCGTIIGGAIAVYEKTINLDDSTAFTF